MWKANTLTAGQILGFKLGVQHRRAVCSTSCGVQTNSLCPSVLFHHVGCVKPEQRRSKARKHWVVHKKHQINLLSVLGLTQFLTNTSGCHNTMWELSLFALRRVFEIWKSNVLGPHLFLPACCSVHQGYCNIGCETTTPPQQRIRMSQPSETEGLQTRAVQQGRWNRVQIKYMWQILSPWPAKLRAFIQNRWQLCKEKEDVPWQPKKNFLCAKHPQWKKKRTEHAAHITSLV